MAQKKIEFRKVFNRKDKLNDKGKALIQIEAYLDGVRRYFSTGIFLSPDEWDNATKTVTRKRKDYVTVNNDIDKLIEQLREQEYGLSREQQSYDLDDLKKRFEKPAFTSFIEFAKLQVEARRNSVSKETIEKQLRHIEKLKEYAEKDVKFSDIKYAFLEGFRNYLFNEDKDGNTVHDYFKRLGAFANMAIKHGYMKENLFKELKPPSVPTKRQVITDKELDLLEKLKFNNKDKTEESWERTRDLFLFQCYTGLRFSDASAVAREHIFETNDGLELRMESKKERKEVKLPLSYLFPVKKQKLSKPEQLIKKYWRQDKLPFFTPERYAKKNPSNDPSKELKAKLQVTNVQLKKIQKRAGVQTKVSNHVGRHFFASFLLDRIPITIIQELLQHSKIETTMIYTHVSNERIKKNLREINHWK